MEFFGSKACYFRREFICKGTKGAPLWSGDHPWSGQSQGGRGDILQLFRPGRVGHLDVEDCSEELVRQQSYAIKNQFGHPKPPTRGFGTQNSPIVKYFTCSSLILYGIRAPIIGPFRAWKPTILMP